MGLKEFIKQSAGNQPDNIREIRIDAGKKQKELPFDPEIEITESDWGQIKATLKSWLEQAQSIGHFERLEDFAYLMTASKLLGQKQVAEIEEEMEKKFRLKTSILYQYLRFDFRRYAIFSERAEKTEEDDNEWEKMKAELASLQDGKDFSDIAAQLTAMKILFPDRARELNIDKDTREEIKNILTSYRDSPSGQYWWEFAIMAMRMRILCPERMAELKIDKAVWRKMRTELQQWRQAEDWFMFTTLAAAMTILAAYKVEVTNEGLKITMRDPSEEFREKHEPMPVRLSF